MGRLSKGDRVRFTIRLPRGLGEWAVREARSRGITLGEYVGLLLMSERGKGL